MISLRKINSILVIIMVLMFLHHAILSVLFLYGLIDYSPDFKITGRRLFYPLVAHIVISLYLYIKDKRKSIKIYPNLISETTQQALTGIAIIVFVSLHILSNMFVPAYFYSGFYFKLMHFLIDTLLFISITLHLRVSGPRLLVTFGFLGSKDAYSKFKYKFNILCSILLIIAIFSEVVYYGRIL